MQNDDDDDDDDDYFILPLLQLLFRLMHSALYARFSHFISDGNREMQWTLENFQGKKNSCFCYNSCNSVISVNEVSYKFGKVQRKLT